MSDWLHPPPSDRLTCADAPPSRELLGRLLLHHGRLLLGAGYVFLLPDAALPEAIRRLVEIAEFHDPRPTGGPDAQPD